MRAFTFFEIAVAIVIAGIVVGGSIPIVLNAQRKSEMERMDASVRTLTDANWRLEITGEGNNITKNGNNKWEALDYYVQKKVLADANAVDLEGLVFSNGVWGTTNDEANHFVKTVSTNDLPQDTNAPTRPPAAVIDPNQKVLDLLAQTKIDGQDAVSLLSDPEGETFEWVFKDKVTGETRTNKVGMWDPITGKSTGGTSGSGDDGFTSGSNSGFGYGSGSIPRTISQTNYNEDGTIASVTEETIWTDGPTAEELGCVNATLSLSITPGSQAGVLAGGGSYRIGDLAYIFAAPNFGWKFKRWVKVGSTQYEMSSEFPLMQVPIDGCKIGFQAEFEPLDGFLNFSRQGSGLFSVWSDRGSFPTDLLTGFSSKSEIGQKWTLTPYADDGHIFRYWSSPKLSRPEFDYSISTDGALQVTGSKPGETSSFTAIFSKLGDHGEDTSGCPTKTVTASVYSAATALQGGAELGEVVPDGVLYKSKLGYFGSIVAVPASGYAFSHWVIEFIDIGTNKTRVLAPTTSSFSIDSVNSCNITAKAFFVAKVATPTPTPVPSNPSSLTYQSSPNDTAKFFVTGSNLGLSSGTVNFPNPGGVRVSIVPNQGYSLKSVSASAGDTLLTTTKISLNSYYVKLEGGANTFLAETEVNPNAPVYAGSLTVRARSESGRDSATIEILGIDQTLFTSGTNWEKGPTSTIPVYAGQTISVKLAQSSKTSIYQILQSHNFLRVQPTGPDTYDIHILPDQFPGGGLDMYVTFITSREQIPARPPDDVLDSESCVWPIDVFIKGSRFDIQDSEDYEVTRARRVTDETGDGASIGTQIEEETRVNIIDPVPGKEYIFTVVPAEGFEGWQVKDGYKAHSYSIEGNVLRVVAGKKTCPELPSAPTPVDGEEPEVAPIMPAIEDGVIFTAETTSPRITCEYPLYKIDRAGSLQRPSPGLDAENSDNGVYHRSSEVGLFLGGKHIVRNSYIRADGKYRIYPVIGANNTFQWVVQKYTEGGAWLHKRTLSSYLDPQKASWGTPNNTGAFSDVDNEFPVCPPPLAENSLYDDGSHDPDITPPSGTAESQGLVSILSRNGAFMQWKVVSSTKLEDGSVQKITSKSGIVKPNSDITLSVGGDQVLEVSAMTASGVTFVGGRRPFQLFYDKYAQYLEFGNYTVKLTPKANSQVILTAPTSGDPGQPTPGGSQTPGQSGASVIIANGSAQLGKILSSKDIMMAHGDSGGSWAILPGVTRTIPWNSLTGKWDRSWPVILALSTDRFQWGDIPGAKYSSDRRVVSFAKPIGSENLIVRAVDRGTTPSPTPHPDWGTVRITSKVSRQPWYFEIGAGSSVVGLVGADSPLVLTEPPADFKPIHYFNNQVGGQLVITRKYDGIVFESSQNRYTAMFAWPKAGENLELSIEDLTPDLTSSPPPMESPGDPTAGQVALIISPSAAAGYFHNQDALSPYLFGKVGTQQTLTARANGGWRLVGLRYSLPGSSMAYTTGLGDSIVFEMPYSGSVTAHFERFVGGSPSPGDALFEPEEPLDDGFDIVSLWFGMSTEERIAYGVQKAISQGLPPFLLTPAERPYADGLTMWRFFGWRGLTEEQRTTIPISQIWGRTDIAGYRIQTTDIKSGYNLGPGTGWSMAYLNFAGRDITGLILGGGYNILPYANFAGANASGMNLSGSRQSPYYANFAGANLVGMTGVAYGEWQFYGSNLAGSNLAGADFSNSYCPLYNVNLVGANIQGISFQNSRGAFEYSNLAGTSVNDIDFSQSQYSFYYSNLAGADVSGNNLSGSGSAFYGSNLIGSNLSGINLVGSRSAFGVANLSGMDISDFDLRKSENPFYHANLTGGNVAGVDASSTSYAFWYANLTGANIQGVNLAGSSYAFGGAQLPDIDLSGRSILGNETFIHANLAGANFTGADFSAVSYRAVAYSNLAGANFSGADFSGQGNTLALSRANLTGANLAGANFYMTSNSIRDAILVGANLSGIDISGDATGTSLIWSNFAGVSSGGIIGHNRTLYNDWFLVDGYILGPMVNLSGADLSGFNLLSYNLAGVNFGGGGVVVNSTTKLPSGWVVKDGFVFGSGVNLFGADFSGLDLQDMNFSGISFGGVKIDSATKLPEGWIYFAGYIMQTGGASSGTVDISGVNIEGADLSQFDLSGWRGIGLTGTPSAIPTGYGIINGTLVGPNINMTGANVAGMDLSSYNLSGASILSVTGGSSAILPSGWNFYGSHAIGGGANMVGSPEGTMHGQRMTGVNFDGVNLSGTVQFGRYSNVLGVDLSTVNYSGGRETFSWAVVGPQNFAGVDFSKAMGIFDGASMAGSNLSGINASRVNGYGSQYSGAVAFSNLDAPNSNLAGANVAGSFYSFHGGNLAGSNLSGVNVTGTAAFRYANLSGVSSGGIIGANRYLENNYWLVNGYIIGPTVNLSGANLSGMNLLSYNTAGIRFGGGGVTVDSNTKLPSGWTVRDGYVFGAGVNLAGANFSGLNLEGVNLSGIRLENIEFDENTKFPEGWTTFGKYILSTQGEASAIPVNLTGMNLSQTDLSMFNLAGWRGFNLTGESVLLPDKYAIKNGMLLGANINLSGGNLAGIDISEVTLNGANLTGANLSGLNLAEYDLTGTRIVSANLSQTILPDGWRSFDNSIAVGAGVNLAGAPSILNSVNLSGMNLIGANFSSSPTSFTYGNYSGVNFSGANFAGSHYSLGSRSDSSRVSLVDSNFAGANFAGMNAVFLYSNLAGVNLSGADFSGTSRLEGHNLSGVRSGGIVGGDGLSWTYFRGGYIVAPGVNLSGENLSRVVLASNNLAGANLSGVNLVWTSLQGTNLSGANLMGANLSGVNLHGGGRINVDSNTLLPEGWSFIEGVPVQVDPATGEYYTTAQGWTIVNGRPTQ